MMLGSKEILNSPSLHSKNVEDFKNVRFEQGRFMLSYLRPQNILVVLAALALFFYLYNEAQAVDPIKHEQYSRELRQLRELDAIVNQDLTRARFEFLTSYHSLATELADLHQIHNNLERIPTFIDRTGQIEIRQALENYGDALTEKESLVKEFKREDEIFKSYLRSFPPALTSLVGNISMRGGQEQLVTDVNFLLQYILFYNLMPNEEIVPEMNAHMNKMLANKDKYDLSVTEMGGDITVVINQARIIIERKNQMDALLNKMISAPTSQKSDELLKVYDLHYERARQTASFYRQCLYLVSLLLLTYISITIILQLKNSAIAVSIAKDKMEAAFDAMREAEKKYRGIFENATNGIYQATANSGRRYLTSNPALARIYGYESPHEFMMDLFQMESPLYVDANRRTELIKLLQEQETVSEFESQVHHKNGQVIWISENVRAVRDDEGQLMHYEGIVQDITERKKAEKVLAEYNQRLEQQVKRRTAQLAQAYREISDLNQRLKVENMRLGGELEVSRQLQRMLLPSPQELQQVKGLEIAGYMEPADEVGGDYYDILQHNGRIKIGIGDVTGHGLESGVVMLMTQAAVRTLLISGENDPARFLSILNRMIYDNVQRLQSDKSLSLALLDYSPLPVKMGRRGGALRLSGQHEELILLRKGGQVELIDTMDLGFPIGLDEDIDGLVDEQVIRLNQGDGVVLYTDGITEAENMDEEEYGLERLCTVLSDHWHQPAEAIKKAVIEDVREHIGKQKVYDDITLLVLKQK